MESKEFIISHSKKIKEPIISGVYFLINQYDEIVYIGQAANLLNRLKVHRANTNLAFNRWYFIEENDSLERNSLELQYIANFTPKFNIRDNPLATKEMHLAISLMSENEKIVCIGSNGLVNLEKTHQVLLRNGITPKIKRANPCN